MSASEPPSTPDSGERSDLPADFPLDALKGRGKAEYGADPMSTESTQLMLAVKRGEPEAFNQLVEGLRGRAFHVARSMVGSRDDAMELTQETFLKVYKGRESFREGEPFLPWFHRILRNTCFSFLRDKKRARSLSATRPGEDGEDHDFEISDLDMAPDVEALRSERARAFWNAFRALSARDREILSLRHFKDLSYLAIADALGIPEGTVMSRLFHARRRLREHLPIDMFPDSELGAKGGRR